MLKDEISRAFRAYFLRCRREGFVPKQPAVGCCGVERRNDDDYVVLRNSYHVLATYRVSKATGRLIYMPA